MAKLRTWIRQRQLWWGKCSGAAMQRSTHPAGIPGTASTFAQQTVASHFCWVGGRSPPTQQNKINQFAKVGCSPANH